MARDPRLDTDPDFIVSSKHNNSLSKLLEEYPEGVPNYVICKVLMISPERLKEIHKRAILKLRTAFSVSQQESNSDDDEI